MQHYHFNDDIVPAEQQSLIKTLFACKNFETSDRLLGYSKGRGTTWFLNTTTELGVDIVLRHYYRGGLFGKLIKDSYLFTGIQNSRAMQEFVLLLQMRKWNLPVPRPVAIHIQQRFGCYQADILLEKIANTTDLSKLLQTERLSPEQYQQIGQLIKQLHQHQVHHSDLNIHNILRDEQGKFWLIDFDKCCVEKGEKWKSQNLNRLLRSFRKEQSRLGIQFSDSDWQNLIAGYTS